MKNLRNSIKKISGVNNLRKIISVFLLVFFFTSITAGRLFAQDKVITLKESGISLEELFKKIEQQSNYRFLYRSAGYMDLGKIVNVDVKNKKISEFLNSVLISSGIKYTLVGTNLIVIAPYAEQPGAIKGKITNQSGDPLVGVTVSVKGNNKGAVTDLEGNYSLKISENDKILIFSFMGMKKQEVLINNRAVIDAVMEDDVTQLREVEVVSTGYQAIPRERATGAFGSVTYKEIEKTPAINLMERLEGKVAGVEFDVRNNVIHIRGQNTYSTGSDSQPLIVVDGFPLINESDESQRLTKVSNSISSGFAILSRINPNDIESITFLKDAASASIWGSKAANGVIVIETKRGKKNIPSITFNLSTSISSPADLSKLKTMNSAQYIDLEKELSDKGFITDPAIWYTGYYTFNTNANASEALEWMFKVKRGTATETERDAALAELSIRDNKSQIRNYLLQEAITQQYNVSITGGGENSTYYISANATKDRPIYKSNYAKSYGFTANTTSEFFNKHITLSTGITYSNSHSKVNTTAITAIGNSNLGLRPYEMLKDNDGNNINRYILFRPEVIDNFTSKGYLPWTYNSIDELNYSNSLQNDNIFRLNASVKAHILDWLDFNISGAYQTNIGETVYEDELNSYYARTRINTATSISSAGKLVYGIPKGGIYSTSNSTNKDYSLRAQININKSWNDIHQLNIIAGSEIREARSGGYSKTLYGFDDETYTSQVVNPTTYYQTVYPWTTYIGYTDGTVRSSKKRYLSYYSNAGYTLFHKYSVSASVRFDDYSMEGVAARDRAKPLWSAGLKWNAKNEKFLEPIKEISNLNFRLTYGIGGSVPTGGYNTSIISISGNDSNTGKIYASINSPANDRLSWETTKQLNGGIDLGLFKNRLIINFDIYNKKSDGILYSMPFNATYGYSNVTYNAASLSSHGFEFGIQSSIIQKEDFCWNSSFTLAYNTNEVTDSRFPKNATINLVTSTIPTVGLSLDYLYVYRWAGLDNTGQSQIYNKNGDIIKSSTNNSQLTSEDLVYAGRKSAPYQGGWTNDFSYKNFTLNVQMNYYLGHKFLKNSISNYPTYVGTYTGVIGTQEDLAYRWKNVGDEASTNIPGLTGINSNSINRYKYSDILVRSASHIRLQQIALSYTVPQSLIQKTPFKSLSASFSMRNLGIIWRKNKDGIDPQYVTTYLYNNLPPTKNYVFSLVATF